MKSFLSVVYESDENLNHQRYQPHNIMLQTNIPSGEVTISSKLKANLSLRLMSIRSSVEVESTIETCVECINRKILGMQYYSNH